MSFRAAYSAWVHELVDLTTTLDVVTPRAATDGSYNHDPGLSPEFLIETILA